MTGWNRVTSFGDWSSTLAATRTLDDIVRGFLRKTAPDDTAGDAADADGFTQKRQITDVYFDTHLSTDFIENLKLTYGLDYLYGKGKQTANNFAYFIPLDGSNAPPSSASHVDETAHSEDRRGFAGAYLQADWQALPEVDVLAGVRLNHTRERARGLAVDNTVEPSIAESFGPSTLSQTRLSGVVGASWLALRRGSDSLTFFGDYRNTYKPLAVDFGPEAEVSTLRPETSNSYELGAKGSLLNRRLACEASAFLLNFNNGLIFDGQGQRRNGGKQRFSGGEVELHYALSSSLRFAGHYAYHDSRFVRFSEDDGAGGSIDVSHRRLQTSPYHLAGLGLIYSPPAGFEGSLASNYTGSRALNSENTLKAGAYVIVDASVGYRFRKFSAHLNGYNLSDRRVPLVRSELSEVATDHHDGDGLITPGYYRLPALSVLASISMDLPR